MENELEEPDVSLHLEVLEELDKVVTDLKIRILNADKEQLLKLREGIRCLENPSQQNDELAKQLKSYEDAFSPYIDEGIKRILMASIYAGLVMEDQMIKSFPFNFMGKYR